jgi:hypothetical protein
MLPLAQRVDNRPAFMLERATSTQDRINWHVAQTKSAALETQARRRSRISREKNTTTNWIL